MRGAHMVTILGTDDTITTCECCGKTNLKHTVAVEISGVIHHYGSVCATKHTGVKNINKAIIDTRAALLKELDTRLMQSPEGIAYNNKVKEGHANKVPAGRQFRAYVWNEYQAFNEKYNQLKKEIFYFDYK